MGKADSAFSRSAKIEDTTMGWRFVNKALKELYGTETMPETAENVAADYGISRADQDAFALAARTRPPPPSKPVCSSRRSCRYRSRRKRRSGVFARTSIHAPPPSKRWPS
jgi:hypothetical protein